MNKNWWQQKPRLTHSRKLNVNLTIKINVIHSFTLENMRLENFQLKKELVKLKLRFGLTTLEGACKELGCCATDFVDEIGEENVISS